MNGKGKSGYKWALQLLNPTTQVPPESWEERPYFYGGCVVQWPDLICAKLEHPREFVREWVPPELYSLPLAQQGVF